MAQIDGEGDALVLSLQQQAVLEYTKAVEINPKHVQAQYNCGTLLYCLGDAVRAVRARLLVRSFARPAFFAYLYNEKSARYRRSTSPTRPRSRLTSSRRA